jgi:hypothetical protein
MFCLFAAQPGITAELASFDSFLGAWLGSGTLWGKPAAIQLQWKRTLAGKVVSLEFDVSDPGPHKPLFAGHDMCQSGQGTWHDTNGAVYCGVGAARRAHGKAVYSVRTGGEVEITDFVRNKDGSWREFAHYVA